MLDVNLAYVDVFIFVVAATKDGIFRGFSVVVPPVVVWNEFSVGGSTV